MSDSGDATDLDPSPAHPWLLLIHQLPPKPDYLRVKIRRRLQRLGAVPLRSSVYVLPAGDEAREDFEWLLEEIRAEGGEAMLCEAAFIAGISDEEVRAMFLSQNALDGAAEASGLPERVEPGRTWVTRQGVHIDRMASAWLIRRFVDPKARFKFVTPSRYRPEQGELRFDMASAEFTHEGELCTFQVIARRFGVGDPAVEAIGEVVRDIDCKDSKYGRAEVAGVTALIRSIADQPVSDEERIVRAAPIFDGLLTHFGSRRR
ncbi:MAG: chromate resistance protein [Gemmatimonadales bacterium]|nr:chromate resistance protein [Gemmatimonadales bacterium]